MLGCPIVKKRKLEEAEAEESHSTPKRSSQPLKLATDEGFNADSDAGSAYEQKEEEEDEEDDHLKENNKIKRIAELMKSEGNFQTFFCYLDKFR